MQKSLDRKLARILADSSCRDFILADAKDADMAFGLAAPGRSPEHHAGEARFRTLDEYRQLMREIVAQGLVDIMLMSASSNEVLTIEERLFDNSHVTPAVRANDTTDIWLAGGSGRYGKQPSQPFRTATIDHIQCGKVECAAGRAPPGRRPGALLRHVQQRRRPGPPHAGSLQGVPPRGRGQGVPPLPGSLRSERLPSIRPADLAPVHQRPHRPHAGRRDQPRAAAVPEDRLPRPGRDGGPGPLRPLAGGRHSRRLGRHHLRRLPHALGGEEVRRPRGPLRPEDQQRRAPVELRPVPPRRGRRRDWRPRRPSRRITASLQKLGIRPQRSLDDDLQQTETASSYSGTSSGRPQAARRRPSSRAVRSQPAGTPDFSKMTQAEKVQWNLDRWKRIVG